MHYSLIVLTSLGKDYSFSTVAEKSRPDNEAMLIPLEIELVFVPNLIEERMLLIIRLNSWNECHFNNNLFDDQLDTQHTY